MVHDSSSCTSRRFTLGICCCTLAACAGQNTPPLSDDDRTAIRDIHVLGRTSSNPGRDEENAVAGSSMNDPPDNAGNGAQRTEDAGTGRGGSGSAPSADAGTMSGEGSVCDGFPILQMKCGNGSFCHGAGSMVSAFAASASGVASFVGERAQGTDCGDDPSLIFDPEDPAASLVVTKLGMNSPCGGPMPLGSAPGSMPPADVACIQEWIGSL